MEHSALTVPTTLVPASLPSYNCRSQVLQLEAPGAKRLSEIAAGLQQLLERKVDGTTLLARSLATEAEGHELLKRIGPCLQHLGSSRQTGGAIETGSCDGLWRGYSHLAMLEPRPQLRDFVPSASLGMALTCVPHWQLGPDGPAKAYNIRAFLEDFFTGKKKQPSLADHIVE